MNKQELFENIKKKQSFLCVGLDTDIKKIPEQTIYQIWLKRFNTLCQVTRTT